MELNSQQDLTLRMEIPSDDEKWRPGDGKSFETLFRSIGIDDRAFFFSELISFICRNVS